MSQTRKRKSANSKFEHKIIQRSMDMKERQLQLAVSYCTENNCRGFAAISAGICPDIKDQRTINRRLDGKVTTGKEKQYCRILTDEKEYILVKFIKNKNKALQPVNRKELNKVIIQMLNLRDATNKKMKGGRKYIPLSPAAQTAILKGYPWRFFWMWFDEKHGDITRKHPSTVALKRVLACTKEMAISHLDDLAAELILTGIFTNATQIEPGVWEGSVDTSRIYNHDETPQFVRYGDDGAAPGLVYCEKGNECKQYISENRECVTIHPFVSLDGSLVLCHIIFKAESIYSNMVTYNAVEKIENLYISTTENGSQDGQSLYEIYKYFNTSGE